MVKRMVNLFFKTNKKAQSLAPQRIERIVEFMLGIQTLVFCRDLYVRNVPRRQL